MATLLDTPKPVPQYDDLVEKRFSEARQRIRLLDLFSAGLWLLLGSMAYLLAILLLDRYVETPPGAGWAAFGVYLALAGGFLYWSLFRPSRRHINPYFVAKQVEANLANAKNSFVNWVDLHDDEKIDVAIRHAVASRAGKDLKTFDVDRGIERKQVVWLAGFGILGFVLASIVYFLPPLRTKIALLQPEGGNATIFSTQDFRVAVGLKGRIPEVGHPEAARLRIWYNPDDLDAFEDRPLEPSPDDREKWEGFVAARQTRTGFTYQVLAGDAATPKFTLNVRILPVIETYEVHYEYPDYVNQEPKTVSDLNLIGHYGTKVTMTVRTNCVLQSGQIQVNGGETIIPATVSETDPQALVFQFPLEHQGRYRIWFTTVEGEKNTESPNPKMTLLDPMPLFTHFDISYHYPAYLRWKDHDLTDIKAPKIDAIRGTRVVLTAHANRPIREAALRFPEAPKILDGGGVPGKPQSVRFELPPLDRNGEMQLWFSPTTVEKRTDPIKIKITVRPDKAPAVEITKPEKEKVEIELPANAALAVDGFATDDFGVKSMALKMKVIAPVQQELMAKPFREGKDFVRARDKSYPIRVDYKDSQKLPELKTTDGKPFPLAGGEIIEYWLEALDNCDVPPAPHKGESEHKRVKVLPPKKDEQNQQKQDQNRQQEEKQNNENQDKKNDNEERNPNQPPPEGGQKDKPEKKGGEQEKKDPPEKKDDPNNQGQGGEQEKKNDPNNPNPQNEKKENQGGEGQRSEEQTRQDAKDLQDKLDKQKGEQKPGPQNQENQKQENPADAKPEGNGNKQEGGENKQPPKPNQDGGDAGGNKQEGQVEKTPKSEPKGDGKQQPGMNDAGQPKPDPAQAQGGGQSGRGDGKPQGKPEPKGGDGATGQKEKDPGTGKGNGDQKRPDSDPTKPEEQNKVASGGNKPDREQGRGEQKPASSEPQGGQQPPKEVASNKAEKSEKPAENKPAPNPKQGDGAAENKPNVAKKDNGGTDPKSKQEGANKPEGNPNAKQDQTAKAENKPDATPEKKEGGAGGGNEQAKKDPPPKIDPKDLRDLANDLKDPKKREEALKKMQNLAGDKQAREEAQKKFDEMMKNANDQEKKEIADAMKDLEKAIKGNDNGGADKPGPTETAKNDPKQGPGQAKPEPKKENPNAKEGKSGKEGEPKPGPEPGKEEIASNNKANGSPDPKQREPKKGEPKEGEPKNGNPTKEPGKESEPKNGNPPKEPGKEGQPKKVEPKEGEPKINAKEPKELAKEGQPKDKPPEGENKPNEPGKQGPKVMGSKREGDPNNATEETNPLVADKKNQLKAGQMQLDKFKANEKALKEEKKWSDPEWKDFIEGYEKMLNRQKGEITQLEKQGSSRTTGPSALNSSERIKMDERKSGDPLQGGKFVAPPGFGDPYKQFTGDLSGVKKK